MCDALVYSARDSRIDLRDPRTKQVLQQWPLNQQGMQKNFFKWTGTTPLTNVGTNALAVATLTGVPAGLEPGDIVHAVPKAALAVAVAVSHWRVPTNGTVVVTLTSPQITTAGSQAAVGWDCVGWRA